MKYKLKFTGYSPNGLIPNFKEGEVIDPSMQPNKNGIIAFIPFTDTRFFEPVKTRTFQVEVSENDMGHFDYVMADEPWTVTEIPTPSWITDYKSSGSYNAHLFSVDELYTIDVEEFKDNYQYGNKLLGVKWIKDRFGKGLKESKELADFIFAL